MFQCKLHLYNFFLSRNQHFYTFIAWWEEHMEIISTTIKDLYIAMLITKNLQEKNGYLYIINTETVLAFW